MTDLHWILLLAVALGLSGCNESGTLGDDDASDDDDIDGDDDDDDIADDDIADDDDITEPVACANVGEDGPGFDAHGAPQDGEWIAGRLGWDGEFLSVAPEFGPAYATRIWYGPDVEMDALMDGIHGNAGRLYRQASASGAWTTHGVVAVATDDGAHQLVMGSTGTPVPALDAIGFELRVDPDFDACSTPLVDMNGCGLGAAVPMQIRLGADEAEVWPGSIAPMDGYTFRLYSSWQVFEMLCDDFDSPYFSWVLHRDS
jgi:hypothetical protein